MYYKYDIRNGIIYDWMKFLIPVIIAVIGCLSFNSSIVLSERYGLLDRNADYIDLLLFIFKGEKPFSPLNNDDFKFPFMWLIIQLSLSFIIGKYPFSEIYDNHGAIVLIKGKSRKKWMISKFMWLYAVCIIYYFLIYIVTAVFSLCCRYTFDFVVHTSDSYIYLCSFEEINGLILIKLLLLPITASIAFSSLQTVIALIFQPVYGFVCVLCLCGLSIFTNSIFFLGNCSILIRNEIFCISDISTNNGLILLFAVCVISFIISIIYFDRCDILHRGDD